MSAQTKKRFKVPHQLIIMIIIAAVATLATCIVPAGTYDMIEVAGRKAAKSKKFRLY